MFSLKEIPVTMVVGHTKIRPTLGRVALELHRRPDLVRAEANQAHPSRYIHARMGGGKKDRHELPVLRAAVTLAAVRQGQL